MAPILGIYASQISGHLWAPSGAYDSIATVTPYTTTTTVVFSGIPSTYTHLQLRYSTIASSFASSGTLTLNGDTTTTNYHGHSLAGNGTAASANDFPNINYAPYVTGITSTPGVGVMDILDYTNTNKYKTMRMLAGGDNNGTGYVSFSSGLWMSTAAITSITMTLTSGVTFASGSHFALFGIRGA